MCRSQGSPIGLSMAMCSQPQTYKNSEQQVPIYNPIVRFQSSWYSYLINVGSHANMIPSPHISHGISQSLYGNLHPYEFGSVNNVITIIMKYMILSINPSMYAFSYWKPMIPHISWQYCNLTTHIAIASCPTSFDRPSTRSPSIGSLGIHQTSSKVIVSSQVRK